MDDAYKVVFILYKYSVVVRGMETKLTERGFSVTAITQEYEIIGKYVEDNVVFVLYLPEDIMQDPVKQGNLKQICSHIEKSSRPLLTVGEEHFRTEVTTAYPVLSKHRWESRPIEMDRFCSVLQDMFKPANVVPDRSPLGEKKRVLIVDDDPSYAGMIRTWIKDIYKTDIVTAGMQAITFLLKNTVDIILLDYEMPVVDGPQVMQMLRQEETTKDIPVVFLTGVSTKEGVSRVMGLKPDGYILKSTTREDLIAFLAKKLG